MTEPERLAEIERLQAMLDSSQAMGGGYKERIAAIETRLKVLRNEAGTQ
jgi:hypothetical protein